MIDQAETASVTLSGIILLLTAAWKLASAKPSLSSYLNTSLNNTSITDTLFNKNNIKVSYSCMENMGAIISKHNKKILSNDDTNDNNDKTM